MKLTLTFAIAVFACGIWAEEEYISPLTGQPVPKDGKYTLEQYKARDERVMKKTGGFVDVEPKGVSVAVLDARQKPGGAGIQFADVFGSLSKTSVKVERKPLQEGETACKKGEEYKNSQHAVFAIVIADDAALPGMTVYPEERLVVVNASKFKEGGDFLKIEERIHKEVWRALGFVSGIGYAPFENDVLQPVFSIQELDGLTYQVMQPMNFQKMYTILKKFGVTRGRRIPYRLACQEGWAAQPTNDYQKAVWDEVHTTPKNPMKIEFDPKKGR